MSHHVSSHHASYITPCHVSSVSHHVTHRTPCHVSSHHVTWFSFLSAPPREQQEARGVGKRLGGAASSRDEGHERHPGEIRMGQVEFVTCHPHLSQAQAQEQTQTQAHAHAHEGHPGRFCLHCHLPSSPVTYMSNKRWFDHLVYLLSNADWGTFSMYYAENFPFLWVVEHSFTQF